MSVKSWHDTPAEIETDKGLARTGAAKKLDPLVIHPHMANRTDSSIGALPTGKPPDASSPLPTDSVKQHGMKTFPVPKLHPSMSDRPEGASFDPQSAFKVVGEAVLSGSSRLPESTEEN